MGGGGGNSEVSQSSLSSDYAFCCQDAKTGRTSGGKDGDERWGWRSFFLFFLLDMQHSLDGFRSRIWIMRQRCHAYHMVLLCNVSAQLNKGVAIRVCQYDYVAYLLHLPLTSVNAYPSPQGNGVPCSLVYFRDSTCKGKERSSAKMATTRWLIHVGCLQMKLLITYFQASSLIFSPHSHRISPGTVLNSHLYLPRSSNTSELLAGASQRLWISAHREMKQERRSGDWSTSHTYQVCNGSWSDVLHTGPCGLRLWAAKD